MKSLIVAAALIIAMTFVITSCTTKTSEYKIATIEMPNTIDKVTPTIKTSRAFDRNLGS